MFLTKTRTLPTRSRTSTTSTGRRLTTLLLKHSFSRASAATISRGSITTSTRNGSILSEFNVLDEHDYEMTRQIMRDLIEEIQIEKPFINFNEIYLNRDDIIGCLLRIFDENAENFNETKRITRENMIKLLEKSEIFTDEYTSVIFVNDWNNLRKQMIKKNIYERKIKTFDFCGFIQLIDLIKDRLHLSKDEILKKIIGPQIYNDMMKLKEIRDKIQLGVLPPMNKLIQQYNDMQMKINEGRIMKKKKNRSKGKTKKSIKKKNRDRKKKKKFRGNAMNQNPQAEQETTIINEEPTLKTLPMLESWIKRDEVDKDLVNKLLELFNLASEQSQHGFIRQNVFIHWLRASQVISDPYALNLIEAVLAKVLARYINANRYKSGTDTFDWNGFFECIRILSNEIHLSLNDFVKKLLIADKISFEKWQTETEYIPDDGINTQENRLWDAKKVLTAVNIMRSVVDESRKLHLTDDERKRLRSLYKEFATFAYRRQSSHLEARLTNSVLNNWMRECRIFDDKYTINELDKDFISILGDFTLNGVYPQGTRDIDFDGFLVLIQTIAAHKHMRADDLVQMIFAGPRSPLQKTVEFNEHMDRTKIQTSHGI